MKRLRSWLYRTLGIDRWAQTTQQHFLDLERRNAQLTEDNRTLMETMRGEDNRAAILERRTEYAEALSMYGAGPWQRTGLEVTESGIVASESSPASVQIALKERFWELELALEDRGWQRQLAMANTEFSRYGIQQIILICRLYFIKNPLVRRGVELCADYVFGRGLQITSDDETANAVLEEFLEANKKQLGQTALLEKERTLKTDGNLFWAFFTDVATGMLMVQSIDAAEIEDVVTDPDNADKQLFFRRRWIRTVFDPKEGTTNNVSEVCWYAAFGNEIPATLKSFGPENQEIRRQPSGEPVYVYHRKVGGIAKWKFGCPEVYPMIDWVRAYKHYLEDWCTMQRAFARFSWDVETKGGAGAIGNLKNALATTLANGGTWWEQNPPPTVASPWISGPGTKLTPIKTPQNNPEASRRVAMMACSAIGLPETMLLGDATTGSLATAVSLDRPTELKFTQRQGLWAEDLQVICGYALERSLTAPKGRLREAWGGKKRLIRFERGKAFTEADRAKKGKKPDGPDARDGAIAVRVTFPAVLEHDITQRVAAIAEALTLNGFEATGIDVRVGVKLLLEELGVEDAQTVIEAMFPEDEYDELVDRTPLMKAENEAAIKQAEQPPPGAEGPGGMPPLGPSPRKPHAQKLNAQPPSPSKASEAAINRAVVVLRRALEARRVNGHA
jgi:hypothetical protein